MPPKKNVETKSSVEKKTEKPKQAQTKLFSKQKVEEQKPQIKAKGKSKKFNTSMDINKIGDIKTSVGRWQYGTGKTPDDLLIASWNVNGLRSVLKKGDLTKYLESAKLDILCLNQTKIDQQAYNEAKIEIPGYHCYWNFCKNSAGYSGVAILTKYLPISLVEDLPEKQHSQQGRVLTMQFQKFYLVTAYIPNASQGLTRLDYRVKQYDIAFQAHCELLKAKKTTFVCGDLNVCHQKIDIARPDGNEKTAGFTAQERQSFTNFLEKGWIDSFRTLHPTEVKYSWWSMRTGGRAKNIGWRLDYFLVNKEAWPVVKQSRINNDVYGSDHCPVELVVKF